MLKRKGAFGGEVAGGERVNGGAGGGGGGLEADRKMERLHQCSQWRGSKRRHRRFGEKQSVVLSTILVEISGDEK